MFGLAARWKKTLPSRLAKLAENIDAAPARDAAAAAELRRVEAARRDAAEELHSLCARFASHINALLKNTEMSLDPARYPGTEKALFQLNVRGRIVVLCLEPPEELVSTESFREPYILEGTVRSFNQELLDRGDIEENLIFYCTVPSPGSWRYFHPRTHQTGPLDENYLVSLFETLL